MPIPRIPFPDLDAPGAERLVAPEEQRANFKALARACNSIGVENLRRVGAGLAVSLFEKPRSSFAVYFDLNSVLGVWANPEPLIALPAAGRLTGAVVNSCSSDFAGAVVVAGVGTLPLEADGETSFIADEVSLPGVAAGAEVALRIDAGTCEGLTLEFSMEHTA